MRVLLIDPNSTRADELTALLRDQNLHVQPAKTPDEARQLAGSQSYSLVVLEEAVEVINGHPTDGAAAAELVQQIRETGNSAPIMVLSDSDDSDRQVRLLDLGADDVLVRPFSPEVMLAQIRSLLRRCEPGESAMLKYEDLKLDLRSLAITRGEQVVSCTSREIAILEYLMRHPQRVISRKELSEAIWDANLAPDSNVIEVFIARLRRKIDKPFPVPLIHTMVGRGYMLSITRPGGEISDN